jgi:Spy/CpxP family protein refolding chaperone
MTNTIRVCFVALALSAASSAFAQKAPPEAPDQDFARYLYPPELIMKFQQKINLRPEQRTTITQAIQQLQSKVVDLQWQMQAEVQKLTELMQAPTIKEAEALAQVDRVLGIERDVKRTHLGALIRIRNTLSRDQQTALDSLQQMWAKKAP